MQKLLPLPKTAQSKIFGQSFRTAPCNCRKKCYHNRNPFRKPGCTTKSKVETSKKELFEQVPIPKALATLAVPTIISQIINLVYNMVDAFFIGRTGNSYMMAATTLTLTLMLMHIAFANLFGIGGGSGKGTMLHAVVRELVFYIPLMFLMDYFWGERGLALALITGETFGAVFALWLLRRAISTAPQKDS